MVNFDTLRLLSDVQEFCYQLENNLVIPWSEATEELRDNCYMFYDDKKELVEVEGWRAYPIIWECCLIDGHHDIIAYHPCDASLADLYVRGYSVMYWIPDDKSEELPYIEIRNHCNEYDSVGHSLIIIENDGWYLI